MDPTPLDYAPPPTKRRGARLAGFIAHLVASYAIGLSVVGLMIARVGPPDGLGIVIVVAAAPFWVPVGFLVGMIRGGSVYSGLWACAYAALVIIAYRHLRKPR